MKVLSVICFVAMFASTFGATKSLFRQWMKFYEKAYENEAAMEKAWNTWMSNWNKIQEHNLNYYSKKKSYLLAMNHLGDMNATEYTSKMNGFDNAKRVKRNSTGFEYLRLLNIKDSMPKTVDWRKEGYVTGVKNQGQCGSCWSFSATGSLEGQHFRKTGKLVSLSEQNLVDCSVPEGNDGCNGGLMDQAFEYIKIQHGIDLEVDYPYEAKDDTCRYTKKYRGATDKGYVDIPSGDEDALKEAAATIGPISVAIDASHSSFQFYASGVYDEPSCSTSLLDHGVLVVGYGTEGDSDYWLVKNSWGESWGLTGYIKMSRNKSNQCGIATQASYPVV